MNTGTISKNLIRGKLARIGMWALVGAALIAFGAVIESSSDLGHHLLLILAGGAIGGGITREVMKR